MGRLFFILGALCLVGIAAPAEARLLRTGFEGIRPLGMGNAFIALADDQNALWYNPAALVTFEGAHAHLLDLTLGVDSLNTLGRLKDAVMSGEFDSNVRTDTQYARMNFAPAFITPYFGFTLFMNSHNFMDIQELIGSNVDIYSTNDMGAMVAAGLPIGKHLSIGFSFRAFQRFELDEFMTPAELLAELGLVSPNDFLDAVFSLLSDKAAAGYAFGLNLGALATIPFTSRDLKWTIGATIDDFTNTSFRGLGAANRPKTIGATVNFGTAFQYRLDRGNRLALTFDWRDALGGEELFKTLHLGIELGLKGFSLRGGIYQGRPSAGFTFDALPHTRLHFTTYGVELGDSLWSREQRWYLLQAVIGFTPL